MKPSTHDPDANIGCGCLALILWASLLALIWALIYTLLTH